jgi:hypothetical protein
MTVVKIKITGRLLPESRTRLYANLRKISENCQTAPARIGKEGLKRAVEMVANTFKGEGSNPAIGSEHWAELAPRTLRERVSEGYGVGPILVRSGRLRDSLTVRVSPYSVRDEISSPSGWYTGYLGTNDPHFERLQTGSSADNLPARPMWPIGASEKKFVDDLTTRLLKKLNESRMKLA